MAQTSATRASSFAYDAGSGLLTQEVIEPDTSALRLQTDYTYNAFGQKTQVTVSGVDIATRSRQHHLRRARASSPPAPTNALGQSESWQYDARFGLPTSHTGPNGLTTTWTYDTFGRKTLEVRADGTRTTWSYQFCSGTAGGTASCPAGGTYPGAGRRRWPPTARRTIGPVTTAYFDQLDRGIASDTEGFDGSAIRAATQYDAQGRVAQKSRPYFVSGGTPRWTSYTYDTLGRVLTETYPDSTRHEHRLSRPHHHRHQRAVADHHHRQEQPGPDGVGHRRAEQRHDLRLRAVRQPQAGDGRGEQRHDLHLRHARAQDRLQRPRPGVVDLHL